MVENDNKLSRKGGSSWAHALEIVSEVPGYIIGPIIFALILGKYLDGIFGTTPLIFLGLTGIAFLFSTFGIVKVVKKYINKITEETKSKDVNKTSN